MRSGSTAQDGLTPLEADPGCCNHLNWRCGSRQEVASEILERRLCEYGYQLRCRHPGLWLLRRQEGHEIAWVRRQNRFQLRVPLVLPPEERSREAEAMYRDLQRSLVTAPSESAD